MQPNLQEDLLQKLQKQEALLKQKLQTGDISPESLANSLDDEFISKEDISIPAEAPQRVQAPTPAEQPAESINIVKQKIDAALESAAIAEVASGSVAKHPSTTASTPYHDEYGQETFYVKNLTNGHVIVPGIGIDSIPKGSVVDLLEYTDLQTLKSSHFLRKALSPNNGKVLLKRLTVEQYQKEKRLKDLTQAKLDQLRKEQYIEEVKSKTNTQVSQIRPAILAKVEKLALGSKPETKNQGISPLEFLEWMESESFTMDELDHIIGSVQDKDIKMYAIQRKQLL